MKKNRPFLPRKQSEETKIEFNILLSSADPKGKATKPKDNANKEKK